MPSQLSYPGVYLEELPSGVRALTGVATSVAAFVGPALRGPINAAVRILSFSDFERRFGGLSLDSDMSYAVRQFFANGGNEAWVVRLVSNPGKATKTLRNASIDVLEIKALDEGFSGNNIELRVDYQTDNPASTFNLAVNYLSELPGEKRSEVFRSLSMNDKDPRFVESIVNGSSKLVSVKCKDTLPATANGTSESGDFTDDVATLHDANHNQFQVSVNGASPVTVLIKDADVAGAKAADRLTALCSAIASQVNVAATTGNSITCTPSNGRILIASNKQGRDSSVRVLPGLRNDLSVRLKLGSKETDAAAVLRPVERPDHGSLTSGDVSQVDLSKIPSDTYNSFNISLDGDLPVTITLGTTPIGASNLTGMAALIQNKVGEQKKSWLAYSGFTTKVSNDGKHLILASGTRGLSSSVVVSASDSKSIADKLKLLSDASATQPKNVMLEGGSEVAYTGGYDLFIGDRSTRKGIYALESVDLFNILCLPGVRDGGILQDAAAYCAERRAFLVIDSPEKATGGGAFTLEDMVALVSGPSLPKSKNAAIFYPWIKIADPLQGGKLRSVPPSGTIAGLFARTDSTRGVWKAPAGTEATLVGVQGVEYSLTDAENGILNPLGVNCIRSFPVYGCIAWGARTLRGADQMADEWKYIPVRRTALFVEESLYRGTKWVVFEPNDEPLWAQIRLNIGAFMHNLFRQGAFQGSSPKDAYFVKCDKETTTQNDIDLGIVNIVVGFAPLKPAEFVVIKLQQMAGQIQV